MGCDIHLFLEIRRRKEKKVIIRPEKINADGNRIKELSYTYKREWRPAGGKNKKEWSDRVYGMFSVLADVRNYYHDGKLKTLDGAPRGLPEDVSEYILESYCLRTIDDKSYEELSGADGEKILMKTEFDNLNFTSESEGEKLIKDYECKVLRETEIYSKYTPDKKFMQKLIEHPDYHSASWCTTSEMEFAVDYVFKGEYEKDSGAEEQIIPTSTDDANGYRGDYIEWVALLNTMKGYELSGEYECRAVFWFDN